MEKLSEMLKKNANDSAVKKAMRLENFVMFYCSCPCCGKDDICADDCTFSTDCENEAQVMREARIAMYQEEL